MSFLCVKNTKTVRKFEEVLRLLCVLAIFLSKVECMPPGDMMDAGDLHLQKKVQKRGAVR
jgi:hypothetical protein